MLNFDSSHEYVKGNLNNIGKKILITIVLAGLIIANVMLFSGCAKTVDCDINETHAHYYVNEDNMGRYIVSEKTSVSGLNRLDDYISINSEDKELLEFINKKKLFKISDNKDAIQNIVSQHSEFKEYRYKYYYYITTQMPYKVGDITYYNTIRNLHLGHSWTKDPNHIGLTGEVRDCHYVYYGYKVIKNDKGKYELVKSAAVDKLEDLPEGYDYITAAFYEAVNAKNEKLNYEDGPMELKDSIPIEVYEVTKGKAR